MSDHPPQQQPGWSSPGSGQFGNNQFGAQTGPGPHGSGHYGGDQSSWQPSEPPRGGGRTGLILGIIAAVAVLAIVIGAAWMLISGEDEADTSADGEAAAPEEEDDGDASPAEGEATAHGTAESYLSALAAADFEEAFSHVDEDPRGSFLTDDMLAESLELAPISDIEVEETDADADDFSQHIAISYALGGEEFSGELHLLRDPRDDAWSIGAYSIQSTISPFESSSFGLNVNGEPVPSGESEILTGLAYQIDVDQENFTLETVDDGIMIVDESWVSFGPYDIILTEDAEDQWRTLIQDEAEACLESTAREAGCGLDMPEQISGEDVIEDTIERTASTSTLQTLEQLAPRLDMANPNLVMTEISIGGVEITYDCEGPDGAGTCELLTGDALQFDRPVVDMTADELEVIWE